MDYNSIAWSERYNYRDGQLWWKNGKLAGKRKPDPDGYKRIKCKGRSYMAHRVIWMLYNNADIPDGMQIDHINRVKDDNHAENLRIVTRSQNARNIGLKRNNTSGATGVYWDSEKEKWVATLTVRTSHDTFLEAIKARKKMEEPLA